VKYFLKVESGTFEGYKFDYVFTTRDNGTGYYWDGLDSSRQLQGNGDDNETRTHADGTAESTVTDTNDETIPNNTTKKPKKKKKKKKTPATTAAALIPIEDMSPANNLAMESAVMNAMKRRNEYLVKHSHQQHPQLSSQPQHTHTPLALGTTKSNADKALAERAILMGETTIATAAKTSSIHQFKPDTCTGTATGTTLLQQELAKQGWEMAKDQSTQKPYYFCRGTGERTWECPISISAQTQTQSLPKGWKEATTAEGKAYYYHDNGTTVWTRPSTD
jgi:hypothetical protein